MASVDVIVPCYQYGHFLRDCAASVLTQDVSDLRLVIIDNASTDNTLEVARELAAADRRVEVIAHGSNLGHLASFNEGIDRASASYFLILCADDLLAPGALARAVSIMERHPEVVLTYGAALVIGPNETIPATNKYPKEAQWRILPGRELLERCCRAARGHIPGPTAVVRTSAQKQVGHYRVGLPHTNDLEVWLRFACLGAIAETDAIQGVIRGHPGNRCSSVSDIHDWDLHFEAAFDSFFAHEGGSLPDANRLRRAVRRALSERAYWGSVTHLLRGNAQLSSRLLRFAFSRWPTSMLIPPFGYLFRREDAFGRIGQVLSEAVRRPNGPSGERRDTP
jgi:glycosyltransferase involved in cell wall biosynthesis